MNQETFDRKYIRYLSRSYVPDVVLGPKIKMTNRSIIDIMCAYRSKAWQQIYGKKV